ncbi:amino acid adenylation domain-containing protein [Micromonospora sp. NPDC126480]|uniref:non-ribosomal peptide synthetase n=1 Tax=Micromonospora sp. NPDC126480 TaxID=3155312 RepID=UPI00332AE1DD
MTEPSRAPLRGLLRNPALLTALHGDSDTASPPASPAATGPAGIAAPGQEQIWFFEKLHPGTAAHQVGLRIRVDGPLDVAALDRALGALVARHAPLRTAFETVDGRPVPVPAADGPAPVVERDLRALADDQRDAECERLVAAELARPFDLGRGPLLRTLLLRLAERERLLLVVVHHIAADGHSLPVLRAELLGRYAEFTTGQARPAPALTSTYSDFARWQHDLLHTSSAADDRAWWRRALDRLPAPLDLGPLADAAPRDRPEPHEDGADATADHRGDVVPFVLPAAAADAAERLAREERASTFMVLLSVFGLLLHRFSGATDLVVGTPTAGRLRPGTENLVGHLVNLLPLRLRLAPDPTLRGTLADVRGRCLDAYAHQDLPFHDIISAVAPERRPGVHPIFQAVFASPPSLTGTDRVGPTTFTAEPVTAPHALYDIELQVPAGVGERVGYLRYRTTRLSRAGATELAREYLLLLEQTLAAPDRHLSNLPRLEPARWERVVVEWNATRVAAGAETLTTLFAGWVRRTPDAEALRFGDARYTYRQLDADSNRLARHLARLGVGPDDRVGLCLDRGAAWIVGALAALKLGAGYLPLDPEYPAQRRRYMARDAGARVVIVDRATRDRWAGAAADGESAAADDGAVLVDLTRAAAEVTAESADPLPATAVPDSLAYVMYTSGSTGLPKGVAVTHRNVIRLVRDIDYVDFRPTDTVAQTSNISFDAATFEVWGALLNGARLVGVSGPDVLDPARLGERIREHGMTTMFLTTSLAMQVLRDHPEAVRPLRHFVFGGEQPNVHAVRSALAHGAPENLVNGYGPTETTTFAATHRCNELPADEVHVPLGRPIRDVRLYVLDSYLQPVAPGLVGELFVGGDGVARGYVGRPALTAERFIPDHLGDEPGRRLYRTGDLARYRPDGTVEFLGRSDRQIKIHGFRIEPGEIEDVLDRSGLVRAATVQPRPDATGQVRLVGYAVPAGPEVDETAIRAHLRDRLPSHLVPTWLVLLPALPLTGNGKLDVAALPDPVDLLTPAAGGAAPTTPTEQAVAQVWQRVLNVTRVTRSDDFFRLGGHSLNVLAAVAGTGGALGVEVPLRLLFAHPTLAGFAAAVDAVAAAPPGEAAGGTGAPSGGTDTDPADRRDVRDLLDAVEAMSDDDVATLIRERG